MVTTHPHTPAAPPIDEHPDLLALSPQTGTPPAPVTVAPAEPTPATPAARTWLAVVAVAVAAGLLGFVAGMMLAPTPTTPVEVGWAPTQYGLAHEHLAQVPAAAGASVSLAGEHLAQVPSAADASVSLAGEHLAQVP